MIEPISPDRQILEIARLIDGNSILLGFYTPRDEQVFTS